MDPSKSADSELADVGDRPDVGVAAEVVARVVEANAVVGREETFDADAIGRPVLAGAGAAHIDLGAGEAAPHEDIHVFGHGQTSDREGAVGVGKLDADAENFVIPARLFFSQQVENPSSPQSLLLSG